MKKLWYVGLESYASRYSFQLTDWNVRTFKEEGVDFEIVLPLNDTSAVNDGKINIGQVLDSVGRPVYAMGQIQKLLVLLKNGVIGGEDVIFFEDMFHPGIESLPYLLDQMHAYQRPDIFVRCLAQTIDPDDFVHTTNMARWMRPYEQSILKFVDGVFAASHEMLTHMKIANWDCEAAVTGLPFNQDEVRERAAYNVVDQEDEWDKRAHRVIFASRLDQEKQPEFFIEMAREWKRSVGDSVEFAFLSGKGLTSNNVDCQNAIDKAIDEGIVTGYPNLSKDSYYRMIAGSRVLVNTALQDWVSNTVSEADALGCNTLFPAYRSFIEVFQSDASRLYVPWSLSDAMTKLHVLLEEPHEKLGRIAAHQSGTVKRTVEFMRNWRNLDRTVRINPSTDTDFRYTFPKADWDLNPI